MRAFVPDAVASGLEPDLSAEAPPEETQSMRPWIDEALNSPVARKAYEDERRRIDEEEEPG